MRHQPKIKGPVSAFLFPGEKNDRRVGKFVISGEVSIGIETWQIYYLHVNGIWQPGATDDKGELTGYYETRAAARKALSDSLNRKDFNVRT